MRRKILITLVALFLCNVVTVNAQLDKYHSLFIYTFTKYIQWPASYQSGDFVIGVLGDAPLVEQLKTLSQNKMVGSQKINIAKFEEISLITKCHILFVPTNRSKDLEVLLQKLDGQSTLIITERAGMAKKGSCINFVLVDGKVKFELNKAATDKANLKVSNELTKLAIEI